MDGNQYGSVARSYVIRNHYEAVLTPGTDIVIPHGNSYTGLKTAVPFSYEVNPETNFVVRRVGVFCNFADGLVFKLPADRIDIDMRFNAYKFDEAYTIDMTYGSKAVTAAGTTGWNAGSRRAVALYAGPYHVMFVDATGALSGNLEDYWQYDDGNVGGHSLDLVGNGKALSFKNVTTLNCMYEVNQFAQPFLISSGNAFDLIAFHCGLNLFVDHTTTLMTHGINPAFARETVFFDVVAEIEFTKA